MKPSSKRKITIGILTLPLTNTRIKKFKSHTPQKSDKYTSINFTDAFLSKTTFFGSNYSSWLNLAQIGTIPIPLNFPKAKILKMLKKLNGVLFTGGAAKMFDSKKKPTRYLKIVNFIINFAKEENKKGRYFLIWGTCLGCEAVLNSLNMKQNWSVVGNQIGAYIRHFKFYLNSKLGRFLKINNVFKKEIFFYFNKYGLLMKDFKNNTGFVKEIEPFALVKNNTSEFIGYFEFKRFPFFLSLFHIEKNLVIKDKNLEDLRVRVQKKMAKFIRYSIECKSNRFYGVEHFKEFFVQHFNFNYFHFESDPERYYYLEKSLPVINIKNGKIVN